MTISSLGKKEICFSELNDISVNGPVQQLEVILRIQEWIVQRTTKTVIFKFTCFFTDYMGKIKTMKISPGVINSDGSKYFHQILRSPSPPLILHFCVIFIVTDYVRIQPTKIFNNFEIICRSFLLANSWFTSFMFLTYINKWSNIFTI